MVHADLATFLAAAQTEFSEHIATLASELKGTIYSAMSDQQRLSLGTIIAENVVKHFSGEQPIEVFAERMTLQRVRDPNYTPESIQMVINVIDMALLAAVDRAYPNQGLEREQALLAAKDLVQRDSYACYNIYSRTRERALQASADEQQHLNEMLRELSSPIIPVHDSILVLPLVGAIDTGRAQIIMEDLLTAIVDRQADVVIIDITGVPLVDTAIANYLLQTTRAVNLLGTNTVLVGIRAEVAQTLASLELDLQRITIRANLQDGITYALAMLGLHISELPTG